MKISVVIPVYKNIPMFLKHFKFQYKFISKYEIIVVDDASKEGLRKIMKEKYPSVKVIVNEENKGFAPTVNIGVQEAKGDLILLLNSDVRMTHDITQTTIDRFKNHNNLFAISFKQKEKDGSTVGKNTIRFAGGFPQHSKARDNKAGINGWAEGGSCLIRREYFRDLGGFIELYAPVYWEDIDLSYRAYSRGWYVEFDPSIRVEHHHESTVSKVFKKKYVRKIAFRNQFIFTWINITDKKLWYKHLTMLPMNLLKLTIKGHPEILFGFFNALVRMSRISKERDRKIEHEIVSDEEIFARFKHEA